MFRMFLFGYSVNTLRLKIQFHLCFSVQEGKRWVIKWPIMSHLHPRSPPPVVLLPPPPICFSSLSHPLPIHTIPLSPLSHLSVISLSSGLSSLAHNFAALDRQSHSFHHGPRLDNFRQGFSFGSCSAKNSLNIMWHIEKGTVYNSPPLFSIFLSWVVCCRMTALIQYGCHLHHPLAVLWICVKQESKLEMGLCQSILGRSPNNIFVEWKRDRKCPDVWTNLWMFGESRFRRTAWGGTLSHWGQCKARGKCGSWWVILVWKDTQFPKEWR